MSKRFERVVDEGRFVSKRARWIFHATGSVALGAVVAVTTTLILRLHGVQIRVYKPMIIVGVISGLAHFLAAVFGFENGWLKGHLRKLLKR